MVLVVGCAIERKYMLGMKERKVEKEGDDGYAVSVEAFWQIESEVLSSFGKRREIWSPEFTRFLM